MHGKNSEPGVEAGCIKDPKCPAYAVLGTKAMRCKGEVKFGDGSDDDTTGMKGLEAKEGKKVFIKGRYKVDIIFICNSQKIAMQLRNNLLIVLLSFRYML